MSYTKEPWHVAPGGDYCDIICQDHVDIARADVEEDARRIVACVNACANVTDEMFANGWPAIGHSNYCYLLTKQRDELLSKVAAWEQKAANWMASPEAAQRLDGYRDIAQRLNVAEQQRDELLAALEHFATWGRGQHRAQSKGCHSTFDMMMLKDEIDFAEHAIASAKCGA